MVGGFGESGVVYALRGRREGSLFPRKPVSLLVQRSVQVVEMLVLVVVLVTGMKVALVVVVVLELLVILDVGHVADDAVPVLRGVAGCVARRGLGPSSAGAAAQVVLRWALFLS